MSDIISRQTAIVALANNRCGNDEWDLAVTHDVETIKKIPSVDPERKPGKWIKVVDEETSNSIRWHYECSLCKSRKGWKDCDYCPNCGAKMEV